MKSKKKKPEFVLEIDKNQKKIKCNHRILELIFTFDSIRISTYSKRIFNTYFIL